MRAFRYLMGMHGLGDNLHQRAVIRQLWLREHLLLLETPWPCLYHDLVGPRLRLVFKRSMLRTQLKNAQREYSKYDYPNPMLVMRDDAL